MNIEQAIDILKNSIADYVIGEYCEKCADNKICDDRAEDCYFQQAIDTVVTAYEKEKEKNKKIIIFLKKDIRDCKNEAIQTKGNENNIGKLSGAKRRHIASMSGRENEAKRILNFLENKEE